MGGPDARLRASTVPVAKVDRATRDEMWALYARHYEGVERGRFERDLDEKRHVVLARARDGTLQGFSTLTRYARTIRGRRVVLVFSGDTVVAPAYWGERALQNAFGRYITATKLLHPFTPVYWFLVSKGYKTYLLLSRNFPERWPRPDQATPAWEHAVLDAAAHERFGTLWDDERGVVRADENSGRLRAGVAPVEAALPDAPDVRFFVERNPRHAEGEELACLGRVDATTWLRYLRKQARRAARAARRKAWTPS